MSSPTIQQPGQSNTPRMLVVASNAGEGNENTLDSESKTRDDGLAGDDEDSASANIPSSTFNSDNETPSSELTENQIRIQQTALANEYAQLARVLTHALEKRTALTLRRMEQMEKRGKKESQIVDDRPHLEQMGKLLSFQVTSIRANTQHEAMNIWRDFYRQKMDLRENMGAKRIGSISKIQREYKKIGEQKDTDIPVSEWITANLDTVKNLSQQDLLSALDAEVASADISLIKSLDAEHLKPEIGPDGEAIPEDEEEDDDDEYGNDEGYNNDNNAHTENDGDDGDEDEVDDGDDDEEYKDDSTADADYLPDYRRPDFRPPPVPKKREVTREEEEEENKYRLEEAKRRKLANQRNSRTTIRFVDPVHTAPQKRSRHQFHVQAAQSVAQERGQVPQPLHHQQQQPQHQPLQQQQPPQQHQQPPQPAPPQPQAPQQPTSVGSASAQPLQFVHTSPAYSHSTQQPLAVLPQDDLRQKLPQVSQQYTPQTPAKLYPPMNTQRSDSYAHMQSIPLASMSPSVSAASISGSTGATTPVPTQHTPQVQQMQPYSYQPATPHNIPQQPQAQAIQPQYYSIPSQMPQYQIADPQQYQYYSSYPIMASYSQYPYAGHSTAYAQAPQANGTQYVYTPEQWAQSQYAAQQQWQQTPQPGKYTWPQQ